MRAKVRTIAEELAQPLADCAIQALPAHQRMRDDIAFQPAMKPVADLGVRMAVAHEGGVGRSAGLRLAFCWRGAFRHRLPPHQPASTLPARHTRRQRRARHGAVDVIAADSPLNCDDAPGSLPVSTTRTLLPFAVFVRRSCEKDLGCDGGAGSSA